ncbi:hypothetical protein NHX12_029682 [Muraenolepis orangiensis]|uniref:MyoD family inhibitor domain containing 2 n=1 Tax=Muraenolepis orangiensis TaxID=630683 RepID=A0A9Q0E9U9_9TELE|nr:hypothetical protein NHX12_029682 [Muraenolepis orangiensis]
MCLLFSLPEGLRREVQQRPGGSPGPRTGPGPGPGLGHTMAAVVNSQEPRKSDPDSGPPLFPVENRGLSSSSRFSSTSSSLESLSTETTEGGVDCAGVVLDCLFCRFYDLLVMLPSSCERAVHRCCPAYKQISRRADGGAAEGQSSILDCDCGLLDACQDTSDCLELAMEMSEMCYH